MKTTAPFACFPSRLRWTAQDLADAVPRLAEAIAFQAGAGGGATNDTRFERPPPRALRGRYLPRASSMPLFRIQAGCRGWT